MSLAPRAVATARQVFNVVLRSEHFQSQPGNGCLGVSRGAMSFSILNRSGYVFSKLHPQITDANTCANASLRCPAGREMDMWRSNNGRI